MTAVLELPIVILSKKLARKRSKSIMKLNLRHFASVVLFKNIKVNEKHFEKYAIYNPRRIRFIKGHTETEGIFSVVSLNL